MEPLLVEVRRNGVLEAVHHVHADDVAQSFMCALARRSVAVGESFHVVSSAALTLRGYAQSVARWFGQEAKLHYRYVWDGFDPHEKSTALRVARGKTMPDALRHVLAELESRHYVENDRPRPRLFASTFDDFVKSEAERDSKESPLAKWFGRGTAR